MSKPSLILFDALSKVFCTLLISALYSQTCLAEFIPSGTKENILPGAEQTSAYLHLLQSKRVGVIVNQTSFVGSQHLLDSLLAHNINVTRILSPEHGFRGERGAGEEVNNATDKKTGIEIVSLYGNYKRPQERDLEDIDQLVFDIQDVGVRYYTYISTMHYVMQACADYNIPLLILDRPNPNGDYIDGPILDLEFQSFIGMHPIPIVHGLTVGELALMINGEDWLDNGGSCELTVIPVLYYDHNMRYSLPIKPSPNLPNDLSVALYSSLGFFEASPVSVGRGTPWPFQVLGYPDRKMGKFKFVPKPISGSWASLNHANSTLWGSKIEKNESREIRLEYFLEWYQIFRKEDIEFITRPNYLDKLAGGHIFREQVMSGANAIEIRNSWKTGLINYQRMRKKYLLYPDSKQLQLIHGEGR